MLPEFFTHTSVYTFLSVCLVASAIVFERANNKACGIVEATVYQFLEMWCQNFSPRHTDESTRPSGSKRKVTYGRSAGVLTSKDALTRDSQDVREELI